MNQKDDVDPAVLNKHINKFDKSYEKSNFNTNSVSDIKNAYSQKYNEIKNSGEIIIRFSESERSDTEKDVMCFGLRTRQV